MSLKRKIIHGVKWTTAGTVVMTIVGVVKLSVLARFLDKSDFGLMAMVTLVMGFMDLFSDMGLTSAILHKQEISKKQYSSLYWFNGVVSLVMYGIIWFLSPIIAGFYQQPELTFLTRLLGLNLVISGIGRQFKTIENKHLLFKQITLIDFLAALFSFGLATYLAVQGYGVYSLVYSALFQYLFSNILFLIMGLRKYGLLIHMNFREVKPFLKIGGFQVGGQVINYLNRDMDVLLIGKLLGPEVLGGYSLAKQLVMRPAQVINPTLMKVASPALGNFQFNIKVLKQKYLKLVNIISIINLPIYAFLALFAPVIVTLFYGEGYSNIVVLVRILCFYMFMRALGNPIGALIIATGKTYYEFVWNLVTLIVTPAFIFLGAYFGILGVSISLSCAMLVLFIPSWKFLIRRMTGATLKEYFVSIFSFPYKIEKFGWRYLSLKENE